MLLGQFRRGSLLCGLPLVLLVRLLHHIGNNSPPTARNDNDVIAPISASAAQVDISVAALSFCKTLRLGRSTGYQPVYTTKDFVLRGLNLRAQRSK